jgi:hypothetical protein
MTSYWDLGATLPADAITSSDLQVGDKYESVVRGKVFRQFEVKQIPTPNGGLDGIVEILRGPYFVEEDYEPRDKGLFSYSYSDRARAESEYQKYGCYIRWIN